MPELDFMVTADYVRAEGGVLHMIAAGFDTMWVPAVPAARPIGVGLRLMVTTAEAAHPHEVELIFQDADGQRVAQVNGRFDAVPPGQQRTQPGRPLGVVMAFNLMIPIPRYGDYSLVLLVDHNEKKSITITAATPPVPSAAAPPGLPGHG